MKLFKKILIYCSILFTFSFGYSQGATCGVADPACAGGGFVFENTSNGSSAESGPNYGCLGTQPNPAWFYLQVGSTGDLEFSIVQNTNPDMVSGTPLDVDFICYGPFTQGSDYCNNLTGANTVGCSFSGNAVEDFTIFNAQEDEIYILLITNFDGAAGYIELNQTNANVGGAGATDCSIVDNISVCENDTYDIDVTEAGATYSWSFDDGSGEVPIVGVTTPILQVPTDLDGDGNIDLTSGAYIATVTTSAGNSILVNNVSFGTIYNPGVSSNIELCEFDTTPQNLDGAIGTHDDGNGTGVWSDDDSSGVNLTNPNAVDFSGLANGIYHYTYTIPENFGCSEVSSTVTVTVSELLLAGNDGAIGFCETDPTLQNLFSALNGTPDIGGTWTDDTVNPTNVDLTDPTAVDFSTVIDGVYNFTYSFTGIGSCPDSSATITVTIDNILYAGEDAVIEFCEGETDPQDLFGSLENHPTTGESADVGGVWTETGATASGVDLSDPTAVDFSTITDGTYEFTYTFAATANCQLVDAIITVTITNLADPGQDGTIAFCEGEIALQNLEAAITAADAGGNWTEVGTNLSNVDINNPTAVDFSSVEDGVYTFEYYFDISASCPRVHSTVEVTISEYRSPGTSNTLVLCEGDDTSYSLFYELGTTVDLGGVWSHNTMIDISDPNNVDFSSLPLGDYDFTYTHPILGTCPSTNAVVTVSINPIPAHTIPLETLLYALCDDDNDGYYFFDLDQVSNHFTGGNPDLEVTYYETLYQLESGNGALQSPYMNINPFSQILYVRVTNQLTGCYQNLERLELIVLESPELPSGELVYDLCEDDGSADGYVEFDLMNYAIGQLGLDPTLSIDFYTGIDTSGNPIGYIPNFNSYTNVTTPDQVIYMQVSNTNTDSNGNACSTVRAITLHVNLLPSALAFHEMFTCDDDFYDETDGIAPFNLEAEINILTGGVSGLEVTFHETIADAEGGINAIQNTTAYLNSSAGDDIFARIYDASTGCYGITHIKLHVDANPTPLSSENIVLQLGDNGRMVECDGNVDGSGSIAEQLAEFDLTLWETLILTGTGSGIETGVSASYYTSYDDADGGSNAIATPESYTNTSNPQTIYVRITSDGTGVIPESSGTGCYTIVEFEIYVPVPEVSVSGNTVLCVDENGVPLSGSTLPVLSASPSTGGYEYQWALNGVAISGANNATYTATEPGEYTVTVSGPTDFDCVNYASITVEESGMPDGFDANVTTTAFSDNHQILAEATSSIPGVEFYYSLDNGDFTTNGLFTNVAPGLHYITITDGEGCWSEVVEVLVIDYPHFFTPNGDGVNDTWHIIGQEGIPISIIYIFDRYGKLLAQLDPDGPGWDGTYNGHMMPAGDYWFKIQYTEGSTTPTQKEFKAHFSIKR